MSAKMTAGELKQEQRELPTRMRAAAAAGDVGGVRQLQERLDSLPHEIWTARVMQLQGQIDELERRRAETGAKLSSLKAAEQHAFDRMKAAEVEHLAAQQAYVRASNELHSLASQIGQLRVRLDQALAEGVAAGPVVRSAWQRR